MQQAITLARSVTAIALFSLTACSIPGVSIFGNDDPGMALASGETAAIHFFTSDKNQDTGIRLQAGNSYNVSMTILSNWVDGTITAKNAAGDPIDEQGFEDEQMTPEFLRVFKRQRDNNWFELMLYQPDCARSSRQGVNELRQQDDGSYTFVASCDGKLSLYVNDTHGFYLNNQGYANIALTRLN